MHWMRTYFLNMSLTHPDGRLLFSAFVTNFARDLPSTALPIVFAQLGPNPKSEEFLNWNLVKTQQLSIQLPMTAMIITDDLPC